MNYNAENKNDFTLKFIRLWGVYDNTIMRNFKYLKS